MKNTIIFFAIILSAASTPACCQHDCELKKSEDSIFVFACKTKESRYKSVIAHFVLDCSASAFAGALLDVERYPTWQFHNIGTRLLQKIGESEIIYHSKISAPWPATDRDLVMHLKIKQDSITHVVSIDINAIPNYLALEKDFLRIQVSNVHYTVTPLSKKKIDITYSLYIDPGGSVPVWMLNLAIANGPWETFYNLKKRIKSREAILPAAFIKD